MEYVSRAGVKLEHALKQFAVDVKDLVCMDVGAATGGFTDCLLQHGAAKVYTIETGKNIVHWKLRNDPRVVVLENTNILYRVEELESGRVEVDFAVVDTSWTKLRLSVPATTRFLKEGWKILALIKPQYEIDKKFLKKGIVPLELQPETVEKVRVELSELGFIVSEPVESPITGESGNHEYWIMLESQNVQQI